MAAGDHTVTGTMTANKVAVTDTVVVANLNADQVDGADKDIDGTLAGNSDASVPTEKAVKTYVDAHKNTETAGVHGSTSAATASKPMHRDASGRSKVAAPAAVDDIARKDNVDTVQTNLNTHGALTAAGTHGSTVAATANKVVHRDAAGRAKVVAPDAEADIALKSTVTALGATCVKLTGNQTVAGVKTFSSAPVFSAGAQLGDAGVALKTKVLTMVFDGASFAETAHGLTTANIRGVCAFPPVATGAMVTGVGFDDDGTTKIRVELAFPYAGSGYAIVFYV